MVGLEMTPVWANGTEYKLKKKKTNLAPHTGCFLQNKLSYFHPFEWHLQ